MRKLKAAIIGCNTIARIAHMPAYKASSDLCEIKYFVDLNPTTAVSLRDQYGSGKIRSDYHEILSDPDLDCVSVCTPNGLHAPISIDFLRAGKHVFCEKPASVNASLAHDMQRAADDSGMLLNIGVCMRYDAAVEKVHRLIQSGALGEIYHIYCSFRAPRAIPGLGGPFTRKSHAGGGALIDWGVHYLDLIAYCTGEPAVRTVTANTYSKLGNPIADYVCKEMWAGPRRLDGVCDVEDFVTGFIRTDGPSISFNGAWAQNIGGDHKYIEFLGDKGGIRLDYLGGFTLYSTQDGMLTETRFDYPAQDMYEAEIRDFLQCIPSCTKNRASIDHAVLTSELMDLIYRSATLGCEVRAEEAQYE